MREADASRTGGRARLMLHDALFSLRGEEMRVELDKKSLFALASDTRVEILRSLQPMRRTVTQLSDSLGIDKAAVHRHLKKMEEGGLVKRYEDHGFVYYGLSWKARDLMSPNENTRIIIMLSLTWVFCIAVVFLLILAFTNVGQELVPGSGYPDESRGMNQEYELSQQDFGHAILIFLPPAAAIACVAALFAYWGVQGIWRPFQKAASSGGEPSADKIANIADDD